MSLKNASGGVLLIAGTAIGAAVLALPVNTAHLGLFASSLLFLSCWFFMTIGALLILEANLKVGFGSNLISMSEKTLGPLGKYAIWLIYLLLLYSLTSAYLNGAGSWVQQAGKTLNIPLNLQVSALIVAIITSIFLIAGTHIVDLFNRILMVALFGAFFTILALGFNHFDPSLISTQLNTLDVSPVPIIITSFGFAIIVPTLSDYLHGKAYQLKNVILIGSLCPLVLYFLWELIIFGLIPLKGEYSLIKMTQPAIEVPMALSKLINSPQLAFAVTFFSIFALTTSILGVTLALFDFLADGLNLKKQIKQKCFLAIITFAPPLLLVIYYPQGFSIILSFAGIFVSLILGLFPVMMVWQARYKHYMDASFMVFGGKPLLIITGLFFLMVIAVEILNRFHLAHFLTFNL